MTSVALLVGVIALQVSSVMFHLVARRRLAREWEVARRVAAVAGLQARVLNECRDLLCEDCREIAQGHYMRHAFPTVEAWLEDR